MDRNFSQNYSPKSATLFDCLTAELHKGHSVGRRGNTFAAFRILVKTRKVYFNFKSFFKNWMSSTISDISLLFLLLLHLKIKEGTSLRDFIYSSLIQTKTNWWRVFILKWTILVQHIAGYAK